MSKYDYCKRGEMYGICTTISEQSRLATVLKQKFIDVYIPLPGVLPKQQKQLIKDCDCSTQESPNVSYYENNRGSHGWCCTKCGYVHQWG